VQLWENGKGELLQEDGQHGDALSGELAARHYEVVVLAVGGE
jgi:hypothetical protein